MNLFSVSQILAVYLALAGSPAQATSTDEAKTAELRRITQELLDAIAPGNVAVWDRYLDARFVHMDENGIVRNKQDFLKELQPLPAGLVGQIEIDRFQATFS